MAPVAGYTVTLKLSGTSTELVDEPTTSLGDGVYQLTDATKRILDPGQAINVLDNEGLTLPFGTTYVVDYLFGTFTLTPDPGAPVIVNTAYFYPTLSVLGARSFSINSSAAELDSSELGEPYTKFLLGQASAEGEVGLIESIATDLDSGGDTLTWRDIHRNRDNLLLEVTIGADIFRAWVRVPSLPEEASNDSLRTATVNWKSNTRLATGTGRTEVVSFSWGT